jgi:hypothetical protein
LIIAAFTHFRRMALLTTNRIRAGICPGSFSRGIDAQPDLLLSNAANTPRSGLHDIREARLALVKRVSRKNALGRP